MTTTRFLFILLVLLNVLVFAAARGWFGFGQSADMMVSGKVINQLRPESIRIGKAPSPESAPAGSQATSADQQTCLAWSGLSASQNTKLISLLGAAGIRAAARDVSLPAAWKVRVPPLPTREAAEILVNVMLEQGFDQDGIQIEEAGNGFSISLGLFRSRASATRHLETVRSKGVYNADIETRSGSERRVEATASAAKVDVVLAGQPFAKRYKPCQS